MSFKKTLLFLMLILSVPVFAQKNENLPVCTISIENEDNMKVNLSIEIAKSQKEHTYGLMNRNSLSGNSGMLFIFDGDAYRNFWMKNTNIALSIAYIDASGTIREIYDMKPLDISITYPSKHPVRYALEVNKGWFKMNKIHVGSKVFFNNCK